MENTINKLNVMQIRVINNNDKTHIDDIDDIDDIDNIDDIDEIDDIDDIYDIDNIDDNNKTHIDNIDNIDDNNKTHIDNIDDNNKTHIDDNKQLDITQIKTKQIKTKQIKTKQIKTKQIKTTQNNKQCDNCKKKIAIKKYDNHINKQLCYNTNEITYCKLCNIMLSSRTIYEQHLFTIDHINNIGCDSLEKIRDEKPSAISQLDKYLNNDEKRIMGPGLGSKFTFVYNNLQAQEINLVSQNITEPDNAAIPVIPVIINVPIPNCITSEPKHINSNLEKILVILQNNDSIKNKCDILVRVLMSNKMNLLDYTRLIQFIKNNNINNSINNDLQQQYINILQKFINMLKKKTMSGITEYNNKSISALMSILTL